MSKGICPNCGEKIEINLNRKASICPFCNQPYVTDEAAIKKRKHFIFTKSKFYLLILLAFIVGIIAWGSDCVKKASQGDEVQTPFVERELEESDFSYTTSQDITSYTIFITPYTKIKSFSVSLVLLDNNNKSLYSNTLTKTSLQKDLPYAYKFDFGFTPSLTGTKVKFSVQGKV